MFIDEATINAERRAVYVERIREAVKRIGVIDGCDALMLANELVQSFEFALEHHLAEWTRVEIRPNLGIGTREWLRVRGRVAERSRVRMPLEDDEPFDILVSCWYRFLISGQAPTPVMARRGSSEVVTATDEEGFFDIRLSAQPELGDDETFAVDLEMGEQATIRAEKAVAHSQVPHRHAAVGVLVDLDGLVLARPTSRFSQVMGDLVLGESHRLRSPLEGMESFMGQIAKGPTGRNPVLYLSNAPRHLHSHLQSARTYARLPEGYLHLRDFDLRLRRMTTSHARVLEMLLAHDLIDFYPELPFVFVGASERWRFYEPLLKALAHRLDGVLLLGEDGVPDELQVLNEELKLNIMVSDGDRLSMHAVQRGWAHA